jgi:hypothetical protein
MARRVFFSFHYERDIWRVNVVRNHWLTKPDREAAGFWDASLWEEAKRKGDAAIKRMIDDGLYGTSVTAVLIGTETSQRKYVQYEIEQSHARGNGLLGVYIHGIKDQNGYVDPQGRNPFDDLRVPYGGVSVSMSQIYPTYHWGPDQGYLGFSTWVETAATRAGR